MSGIARTRNNENVMIGGSSESINVQRVSGSVPTTDTHKSKTWQREGAAIDDGENDADTDKTMTIGLIANQRVDHHQSVHLTSGQSERKIVSGVKRMPFRFNDLPVELHVKILAHLLVRVKMITVDRRYRPLHKTACGKHQTRKFDLSVFLVSKQVYREAAETFYAYNVFEIHGKMAIISFLRRIRDNTSFLRLVVLPDLRPDTNYGKKVLRAITRPPYHIRTIGLSCQQLYGTQRGLRHRIKVNAMNFQQRVDAATRTTMQGLHGVVLTLAARNDIRVRAALANLIVVMPDLLETCFSYDCHRDERLPPPQRCINFRRPGMYFTDRCELHLTMCDGITSEVAKGMLQRYQGMFD